MACLDIINLGLPLLANLIVPRTTARESQLKLDTQGFRG